MQIPTGAPISPLFEIRDTPHSGRAVFASQDIPADTLIWRSDDLTLDVIIREYRREVCGECFNYDYGRDLNIRDQSVGFVFCSGECQTNWNKRQGDIGVQAWTAVEQLVKKRSKEDADMVDVDLPRPKPKDINKAWEGVGLQAELLRTARAGDQSIVNQNGNGHVEGETKPTKQHRKALQKVLMQPISPDVMTFCVSGLLWKYNNPDDWGRFLALAADDTPYTSSDDLLAFTRTYLHLLAILPLPLLPHVTAESLRLLSTRDAHNSFGIRSLDDDGSEFFGYGCWPAASYFNHSCAPTIEKNREGRVWYFRAGRDMEKGDELCITYLSGEERRWSRGKRMQVLKRNWGFDCECERCASL